MVQRIEELTPAQMAQMAPHADQWIETALRTGPFSRRQFQKTAIRCYEAAATPWHDNVVWVSSPLVLALAAPVAALLVSGRRRGLPRATANSALGTVIAEAVRASAEHLPGAAAGALRGSVHAAINAAVTGAVNVPGPPAVRAREQAVQAVSEGTDGIFQVENTVYDALRTLAGAKVRKSLDVISDAVEGATCGGFGDVRDAIARAVTAGIDAAKGMDDTIGTVGLIAQGLRDAGSSFHGVEKAAHLSFLREVCGVQLPRALWERARAYEALTGFSLWWCTHRAFLMVSERPLAIHRELADPVRPRGRRSHRLHCPDGPALPWGGGFGLYAFHGRRVPAWIVEEPDRVSVRSIEAEPNAEVRRLMLERYGWARYITDCDAQVVDECGADHLIAGLRGARLLRKELPGEREPLVYLDMINSTPEPDGTYRHYLERIDPNAYFGAAGRLCHAAMASRWHHRDDTGRLVRTFRRWQDYLPDAES